MQASTHTTSKFSPLIIYLDLEAIMTTHKVIKKLSYRQICLISDCFGLQPFSEIIIEDNKMAVASTSGREQRSRLTCFITCGETGTLYISFFTLGGKLLYFWIPSQRKHRCKSYTKRNVQQFLSMFLPRWADIVLEWLASPDPSWTS